MTEPSDESVAELTPDQMHKYMELLAAVDEDAIAPIKQEWIERVRRAPRRCSIAAAARLKRLKRLLACE